MGNSNIVKNSSTQSNARVKEAIDFFENNEFTTALLDYIEAHERAQEKVKFFNLASPILDVLSIEALVSLVTGNFDAAFAQSLGKSISGVKGKIEEAKKASRDAINAYGKLSTALYEHLTNIKYVTKYAEQNEAIISELCNKESDDGYSSNDVTVDIFRGYTKSFVELLELLEEFIKNFKVIMKPYSDAVRAQEKMLAGKQKYKDNPFIDEGRVEYKEKTDRSYVNVELLSKEEEIGGYRIRLGDTDVFTIKNLAIKMPMKYISSTGSHEALYDGSTNKIIWSALINANVLSPKLKWYLFPRGDRPIYEEDNNEQRALFKYFEHYGFADRLHSVRLYLDNYLKRIHRSEGSDLAGSSAAKSYYDKFGDSLFELNANSYINSLKLIGQILGLAEMVDASERSSSKAKIKKMLEDAFSLYLEEYISKWFVYNNKELIAHTKSIMKKKEEFQKDYLPNIYNKEKIKNLEKNSHSINNTELVMKNANYSDQYYADAASGLNNSDPLLKEFYDSMKQETLRRSELRDDRKNLKALEESQDTTSMAHPKSIKLTDGHGDGGLVENGHEQKEKSLEVAKRNPTGNFVGRYAWVRDQLKK